MAEMEIANIRVIISEEAIGIRDINGDINSCDTVIKPCPFCGGRPFVSFNMNGKSATIIECQHCRKAHYHGVVSLPEAVQEWNKRSNNDTRRD